MLTEFATLATLLWGTLALRPYVVAFLVVFMIAASRDLGPMRAAGFFAWGWVVAFVAEWASTRIGVPFGLYAYTGDTAGLELFVSNVPLFTPLSFPFLAYGAFCVSRQTLGGRCRSDCNGAPKAAGAIGLISLSGLLMMFLDVVIDPLAVRGDRWFLGRIFYYPDEGIYYGVPVSNFVGWAVVGWLIVGGYVWVTREGRPAGSPWAGIGLYYAVLAFNVAITLGIGELGLAGVGILVHTLGVLVLYALSRLTAGLATGDEPAQPSESLEG